MDQQPIEPKKRRRPLVVVGIAAGVLVGLCLCLAVLGALLPDSDTNTTEVPAAAEPSQRAEEVAVATGISRYLTMESTAKDMTCW